jgi:hypothetical protein
MTTRNSINLAKQVDSSKISFDGPIANNYGGKFAKVLHKGSWLLIQTTKMLSPFGVNVYEEMDKSGNVVRKAYSIDVSFNGYQPDPDSGSDQPRNQKVKDLYDMVVGMEDRLVDHATENNFTWVDNPDASRDVCRALLRSGVKWSRDKTTKQINKKYAPRFKFNLPVWDDGMGFKAFLDTRDNEIKDIDTLVKVASGRCEVVIIARCDKVTFNGGKYGYKWSVQQIKIYSTTNTMSGYAFIEDSDEEGEERKPSAVETTGVPQMLEDSESESDQMSSEDELDKSDSEEEEEVPPPVVETKKRRVVRKKK